MTDTYPHWNTYINLFTKTKSLLKIQKIFVHNNTTKSWPYLEDWTVKFYSINNSFFKRVTIIHGNGRVKLRDKKTWWKSLYTVYTTSSLPTDICYDVYKNWVFDILSVLCHNIDCAISNSNKLSRGTAGWYKSSYFKGVSQRQANKNGSNLTQLSSEEMHKVIRHVPDNIVCGANMGPS